MVTKEDRWRNPRYQDSRRKLSAPRSLPGVIVYHLPLADDTRCPDLKDGLSGPGFRSSFVLFNLSFSRWTFDINFLPKMNSPRRSLSSATTEEGTEIKNIPEAGVQRSRTASFQNGTDVPCTGTTASTTENVYSSSSSKLSQYLFVELDPRRADIILIICGFVGGLVDGLSFNAWGSFSSMQTGLYFHLRKGGLPFILTSNRKYCVHRLRCIRATRIPGVPVGKVPHRLDRLPTQQHLLYSSLSRSQPTPTINTHPLLRTTDYRHHRRRRGGPGWHRQSQTRKPSSPDRMDSNHPNHTSRLPSCRPNLRVPSLGFR